MGNCSGDSSANEVQAFVNPKTYRYLLWPLWFVIVPAALSALTSGVAIWIPAHFVYALPYDYLASVGAAFGAYFLVGLLERMRPAPAVAPIA